ncbi:formylglycine-generating enzyme family protein, partial [Desulfovibrio sp. OttesenSCG-928-I05]|nr:formylglycine-generating enzyme family protein [Desulfovibrio sp. OttesenSCG-928-I05]
NLGFRLVFIPLDSSPEEPEPFVQREPERPSTKSSAEPLQDSTLRIRDTLKNTVLKNRNPLGYWKLACLVLALACLWLLFQSGPTQNISRQISGPTHTNSIGMEFVRIPAGSFMMGTDAGGYGELFYWAITPHKVTHSRSFYLGKYEVTQAQWETVMGNNPSENKCQNCPVNMVSWDDAQEFITRLNTKEGHSRYRLPTEAEWEYAAKAETHDLFFFGKDVDELSGYAWCYNNSEKPRPVGGKLPNPWGLHDMYGNVEEWVQDFHSPTYYADSPRYDPEGPSEGTERVVRGGAFGDSILTCNSAARGRGSPIHRSAKTGFRLAISAE